MPTMPIIVIIGIVADGWSSERRCSFNSQPASHYRSLWCYSQSRIALSRSVALAGHILGAHAPILRQRWCISVACFCPGEPIFRTLPLVGARVVLDRVYLWGSERTDWPRCPPFQPTNTQSSKAARRCQTGVYRHILPRGSITSHRPSLPRPRRESVKSPVRRSIRSVCSSGPSS